MCKYNIAAHGRRILPHEGGPIGITDCVERRYNGDWYHVKEKTGRAFWLKISLDRIIYEA
jgi:hypothetical protein